MRPVTTLGLIAGLTLALAACQQAEAPADTAAQAEAMPEPEMPLDAPPQEEVPDEGALPPVVVDDATPPSNPGRPQPIEPTPH